MSFSKAALLAGSVMVLIGCAANGLSSDDGAQSQTNPAPLAPGNDYDNDIGDSGDGVVDASVVSGNGDSLVMPLDMAATEKADLWQRARTQFVLEQEDRPRLEREKAWFQRNQGYMDRVADRAQLYLHHTVSEVERRNMPGELAMLPAVARA